MVEDNLALQLTVFACGNPSRGDDALGPELMRLLRAKYVHQKNIQLIEDFQLQVEHALDLENCHLALFIDADVSCPPPFILTRLQAAQENSYTTHALHPATVLYVYQQICGRAPPPAFLLSLRGEHFELGEPLSQAAKKHLVTAFELVNELFKSIDISQWEALIDERTLWTE